MVFVFAELSFSALEVPLLADGYPPAVTRAYCGFELIEF